MYAFPAELVDQKRRFLEAEAVMESLGLSRHPGAPEDETVEARQGRLVKERERYAKAYTTCQDLAVTLLGHAWWETVPAGERNDARIALRQAARAMIGTEG